MIAVFQAKMVRTMLRLWKALLASCGALVSLASPVRAASMELCLGDGCGSGLAGFHQHCQAATGRQCWDRDLGTHACEVAGICAEGGGLSSGTLTESNVQVAAVEVANEIYTQFVVSSLPSTVNDHLSGAKEVRAPGEARGVVSSLSGELRYDMYEISQVQSVLYGGSLGYDLDSQHVALGVRVPLHYLSFGDIDFSGYRTGAELSLKAHVVREPWVTWNLGAAGFFNWIKFQAIERRYYYGGGPFTSLDLAVGPVGLAAGAVGIFTQPDAGEEFLILAGGVSAGVPLGSLLAVGAHGYTSRLFHKNWTQVELDPARGNVESGCTSAGIEIAMVITRGWTLKLGYDYRFGFDHYTSNEVLVGTSARF